MFWPLPFGLWLTMSQSREELNSQEILQLLATLRICDQPREVCPYPKSHHSILGHHGGLMMISLSQRNERHGQRLPVNTTARDPFCLRSIKYDRSNVSQIEGSIISSCLHSFKATVTLDHTVKEQLVWSVNDLAGKSNPRPHSENRCIPSGLGCSFRRSSYWQSMVSRGVGTAHQLHWIDGRCTSGENICKAQNGMSMYIKNRQQNRNLSWCKILSISYSDK